MASPGSNFDAWLDARLRAVKLPDGLLERLQQIPAQIAVSGDDELDALLRDVPLPPGLLRRLEAVARTGASPLDATLREVRLPRGLLRRLRRISVRQQRPFWMLRLAVAASLLVGMWLCYVGAMTVLIARNQSRPDQPLPGLPAQALVQSGAPSKAEHADPPIVTSSPGERRPAMPAAAAAPRQALVKSKPSPDRRPATGLDWPEDWSTQWGLGPYDDFIPVPDTTPQRGPALSPTGTALGTHGTADERPDLKCATGLKPHGIPVPLAPGFDLAFFMRSGVHPFVCPAAHPKLQTSIVPLAVPCSSYELTRRYLEDGELPPPAAVRTEEFLAALDYGFARPKGEALAVHAAGGPSPFGGEALRMLHGGDSLRLLQIAVQAQDPGGEQRPLAVGASHLVARDVCLKVTFNPSAVLEYRLLGHEAAALAGLLPAPPETDFYAGQSATALYEIRLKPGGSNDVAAIDLTWRDPAGKSRGIGRKVTRNQFAATIGQSAPSLQAAAFVAEMAELLRQSPFVRWGPNPGSLSRTLDLLPMIDSRLNQRPTFADCVGLAQQAEKLRPHGRGGRK